MVKQHQSKAFFIDLLIYYGARCMINLKNQFIYIFFSLIIFSGSFLFVASNIQAQEASEKPKKEIKYRKARALQSSTAKKVIGDC